MEQKRHGWKYAEHNFDELYGYLQGNGIYLGPYQGTSLDLRKGVKYFAITEITSPGVFYYISSIRNGIDTLGYKMYKIQISKSYSISGAGTVVISCYTLKSSYLTGKQYFYLGQTNKSGLVGEIVLDEDQLSTATNYTATS